MVFVHIQFQTAGGGGRRLKRGKEEEVEQEEQEQEERYSISRPNHPNIRLHRS